MNSQDNELEQLHAAVKEVKSVIVGQDRMLERLWCCLLAGGHALLEGVPGVGKTMTVATLAKVVGGTFNRIQFTTDLLPSDIVGTRVWLGSQETFRFEPGPVFANFVLADEINRAPAKVQSALLEVMAERQVTVAGNTMVLPAPFLVMATQNPIENEGVFPLPEAQRDRFMMRINVPLPSAQEELAIVERVRTATPEVECRLDLEQLVRLQQRAMALEVPAGVAQYAVRLTMATRDPGEAGIEGLEAVIANGASPRATIAMDRAARAMALLRGRDKVTAQDVYDVAYDVLNHRIGLKFDAIAHGISVHDVCTKILTSVNAPHNARP